MSSRNKPTSRTSAADPRTDLDARLEAEIEASLGDLSIEDMLDEADKPKTGRGERTRKTGTIVSVHGDAVYVEFGPKSQGMCPLKQFEPDGTPALGARMEFNVDRFDKEDGLLILSRIGSVQKAEWESLEVGQVVEARCTGVNKGGLEMEVANHRAFMPAGQVDIRHIDELSVFVGEKMPCEVMEVDRQRGRIILSRRSALEAERSRLRDDLFKTLEIGQTRPAVITSIQPYGAFADIGGVDGLIHISDLAYERIKHPSEVVKVGQQVEVRVLKLDTSQNPPKIGLGLKQTLADPYESKMGEIKEGETVSGKVTKLMAFGAFVEIAPGVEGLIHISELSHERVHRVNKVVKEGEVVSAKVLSIDPDKRRIALSLKALREKQEQEMERKDDAKMRKLREQLNKKFGELRGGLA